MQIHLLPIPVDELRILAGPSADIIEQGLRGKKYLPEALPPDFVAARSLQQITAGKPGFWCSTFYMVRTLDDTVVGSCGFKDIPHRGRVEIGYGVSPQARKMSYATDAVAAMLSIALATDEVHEVLAQVSPGNTASTRLVQRLNFKPCGQQLDHEGEMLTQWVLRGAAWGS